MATVPYIPGPGMFSPGPGMVAPQITGSTYQNMSPEGERRMYELEDEKKRKREAANAVVLAQRNAQQQTAQDAANREKVHSAFNEFYGPQLQRNYHDLQFMKGTPESHALQARWGPDYLASGMRYNDPKLGGGMPHFDMPQNQLQAQLDNMWRQKTDPYLMMAQKMGGDLMLAGTPGVGGGPPSGRMPAMSGSEGGGGKKKKSTTKPQEVQPGGIDWQKAQGPGDFQYELFGGR